MNTTRVLAAAAVLVVLAGCSSSPDDAPPTVTTTVSAGASPGTSGGSSPAPVPDTSTAAAGCAVQGPEPAADAVIRDVGDVDGDGQDDEAWLAPTDDGAVTVGIRTAAGGGSAAAISSASPVARSLLVADADGDGRSELFFSDGRTVDLYAFDACTVTPVLNQEGATYEFDLGFRGYGTGVGCVTVDGVRHLVGLNRTASTDTSVDWTRTVIEIDGLLARNGATQDGTYALPADQGAADLLSQVTCGEKTVAEDGITLDD